MFTVRDFVIVDGVRRLINTFTSKNYPSGVAFRYDKNNNALLVVADHHNDDWRAWTVVTYDGDNILAAAGIDDVPKHSDLSWAV